MRAVICADLHIGSYRNGIVVDGVNSRQLDIRARMDEILHFVLDHNNDTKDRLAFIILGDVFRDKHPDIYSMTIFANFLAKLNGHLVDTYIISGNHDVSKIVGQPHALAPFKEMLDNNCVHIIDAPLVWPKSDGTSWYFFPYQWQEQDKPLKDFLGDKVDDKDYIFLHGSIEGGSCNKLVDYELFDEDVIKYSTVAQARAVFAGHIHDGQNFKNVWYPGSVERLAFGDELSNKHFLYVEDDGKEVKVTKVPLNARPMRTLHYSLVEDIRQGKLDIKEAIVRITGVPKDGIQEVRKILVEAGCHSIAALHTAEKITEEMPKSTTINVQQFVRDYAQKVHYEGDVDKATRAIVDTIEAQS